jgi:hypothetical protein
MLSRDTFRHAFMDLVQKVLYKYLMRSICEDGYLRSVVRATAEGFLSERFDPLCPPDIDAQAALDLRGVSPGDGLKVVRYASATAIIHKLFHASIQGTGVEARFITSPKYYTQDDRQLDTLYWDVSKLIHGAGEKLMDDPQSGFQYLLDRYIALSERDEEAAFTEEEDILEGGNLPFEGRSLVGISVNATKESQCTAALAGPARARVSHDFTPIVTGRASKHLDAFSHVLPTWTDELEDGAIHVVRRGSAHALVHQDGGRLFRIPRKRLLAIKMIGPLLKCPAHQPLFGRHETALELGLHAVINLARDRGLYG